VLIVFFIEFGENIFTIDNKDSFIRFEKKVISVICFVIKYKNSKHHLLTANKERKNVQQLIPTTLKKLEFNFSLCKAMWAANIPIKMCNPPVKGSHAKHKGKKYSC